MAKISFEYSAFVHRDIGLAQRVFIASKPLAASLHIERSGDDCDSAMPPLDHVAHTFVGAPCIVEQNGVSFHSRHRAVETDEGDAGIDGALQVSAISAAGGSHQNPIHAIGTHRGNDAPLPANLLT